METEQFGKEKESNQFTRLRSAWHTGRDLAALVKPESTDGGREESGRGVRELQGK